METLTTGCAIREEAAELAVWSCSDPRPGLGASLLPAARLLRLLVRLLQVPARLVQRALGVVVGLNGLPVFGGGPFPLTGNVENLPQLNVAPDFGPARFPVSVKRITIGVGRRLVVVLQEKYFSHSIVRQGTVFIEFQLLVEFRRRPRHVSLLHQALTALNAGPQLNVG